MGRAWVALADDQPEQEGCLKPDEIWDAVWEKLPARQTRQMADHLARCPACSESWQLARSLALALPHRRPALAGWPAWAAAAAALVLLAGMGMERLGWPFQAEPPMRQAQQPAIRSLLSEEKPLPRNDFVLLWTPPAAQQEVRYRATVTTEALDMIAEAEDLRAPRFRIPPERLSGLPSGTLLQWQIQATMEDGRQLDSPTFLTRLQ